MADNDDFEIITDTNPSEDPTFELIDVQEDFEQATNFDNEELPYREPPLATSLETTKKDPPSPVFQSCLSTSPNLTVSPAKIDSNFLFNETVSLPRPPPPFVLMKKSEKPTSLPQHVQTKLVLPSVPSIPPAPVPRRYGDAATIPHNLSDTSDLNDAINKSRRQQQLILQLSSRAQQLRDVETVLEQRRILLSKTSNS